jgi:DNA-binding PadR family transcriptional regulator
MQKPTDDEKQKAMEILQPAIDQVIDAGWATGSVRRSQGVYVEWTPAGKKKLRELWQILSELDLDFADPSILVGIWTLAALEAERRGDRVI